MMIRMKHELSSYSSQNTELQVEIVFADDSIGNLVFLNGGGNIPVAQRSYVSWQEMLAVNGITSMVFDYRGLEGTGVGLNETSMDTRLSDARAAVKFLRETVQNGPLVLLGVSMGAPAAIELAQEVEADGLVIVSPAAYSEEAHHKNFGPEFSEAIRKPNNWVNSPDFEKLRQFEGWIVVAYGERDTIVPIEIRVTYADIATEKGETVFVLPVEHNFARPLTPECIEAREKTTKAIVNLLSPGV